MFADNVLFKEIAGDAGQQLGRDWHDLEKRLATPSFPFGIIGGGRGGDKGYNPLLPGDNDTTVSVDSTKLPGARDFLVLPTAHTFIMDNPKVQECVLRFLQEGYFVSEAERHPLETQKGKEP